MGSGFEIIFVLLLLFSGGTRGGMDVLDSIPTDTYWQIKNVTPSPSQLQRDAETDKVPDNIDKQLKDLASDDFKTRDGARKQLEAMGPAIIPQLKPASESKDPEVASTAAELIARLSARSQERAIRRLMAIRTLGELKDKQSLPLLKSLLDSKELFVSDYARRAVAQIEANKLDPVDHTKEFQFDAGLLPEKLSVVGQATGIAGQQMTLTSLIDMAAEIPDRAAMMIPNPGPGDPDAPPPPDKKKMLTRATSRVLQLVENTGNMRFDGLTLGVTEGPTPGAIVILRGKYDSTRVLALLKELAAAENPDADDHARVWNDGPVNVIDADETSAIILPSNEQLVLIEANGRKAKADAIDAMVAALKTGKGTFSNNKDLVALQKTVNTTQPVWAVAKLNDLLKDVPFIACFETLTLETKPTREGLAFTFRGVGTDAEKVKTAVGDLEKDHQSAVAEVQKEAQARKALQPAADFLSSMKIGTDGVRGTLTGEIKSSILTSLVGEVNFLIRDLLAPPEPDDAP